MFPLMVTKQLLQHYASRQVCYPPAKKRVCPPGGASFIGDEKGHDWLELNMIHFLGLGRGPFLLSLQDGVGLEGDIQTKQGKPAMSAIMHTQGPGSEWQTRLQHTEAGGECCGVSGGQGEAGRNRSPVGDRAADARPCPLPPTQSSASGTGRPPARQRGPWTPAPSPTPARGNHEIIRVCLWLTFRTQGPAGSHSCPRVPEQAGRACGLSKPANDPVRG